MLRLACWNVNGIRAVAKKGFFDWLPKAKADIIALQETKIDSAALNGELRHVKGYTSFWNHAERKGYSGVAIYSREEPLSVQYGMGASELDSEGRMLVAEYNDFIFLNVYFPNGKRGPERLKFKMDYYDAFLKFANKLQKKKPLVICGDFNTAHKEIDLARPKQNVKISGFLPEERAWMDKFVKNGYIDTFREFNEKPDNYTWWDQLTRARDRNVGWRIDYFFTSGNMQKKLRNAQISNTILGSDHCPITLELNV
jgi:exodeoxyribonuclease III